MSLHDDFARLQQQNIDLFERVRRLERLNPLDNSSIDSSPGLVVKTPGEGIHVKPGSSISVEGDAGVDVKPGASVDAGDLKIANTGGTGSVKAGPSELSKDGVGSGGTKIAANGKIASTADYVESEKPLRTPGVKSLGGINADGGIISQTYIEGRDAVWTPWQGSKSTVEAIMGGVKTTAQNAASAASGAAAAASTAQTTANQAKTAADDAQDDIDGIKDGSVPLQSPTMIQPKFTGLTAGGTGSGWVQLLINTTTGQLRMYGGGPIG